MIEQALYKHLISCQDFRPYLTTYGGEMAIFSQEIPADTDSNWDAKSQYGRIVFFIDSTDDPERKIGGQLVVYILRKKEEDPPEEIEPIVKSVIDGYFFTQNGITVSATWSGTNYESEPTEKVNAAVVTFTLLAYPQQTSVEPDPIAVINKWTKEELALFLEVPIHIIGHEDLPPVFKPTDDNPAIYWRNTRTAKCTWIPDTYHCSWQTATLQGHIFAGKLSDTANFIARVIDNCLTQQSPLKFEDSGPLYVDRANYVNTTVDTQRTGQITVEGTYGILNRRKVTKLEHITVTPV